MDQFLIFLQAKLDETKSIDNFNGEQGDIAKLQKKLDKLKLQAALDPKAAQNLADEIGKLINQNIAKEINQSSSEVDSEVQKLADRVNEINRLINNEYGASAYQNQINGLINDFQKYGVTVESAKTQTSSLQQIFDKMKELSGQELVAQADRFEQEFKAVKISVDQAKLSYDNFMLPVSNEKATGLINRINTFLTKNTKITKDARAELEAYADELTKGVNLSRWDEIDGKLKETENSMRGIKRLGALLKDQMSQAAQSFTQWLSVSSAVTLLISKTKNAISDLKEINKLLTVISKANGKLSKAEVAKIGNDSFDIASKYGKNATDFLSGVQEAFRAGYENAMGIVELFTGFKNVGMAQLY